MLVVFLKAGPSIVHVWALGLSCETPAAPLGPKNWPEPKIGLNQNLAWVAFGPSGVPAPQTPSKFHKKTPRGKKE